MTHVRPRAGQPSRTDRLAVRAAIGLQGSPRRDDLDGHPPGRMPGQRQCQRRGPHLGPGDAQRPGRPGGARDQGGDHQRGGQRGLALADNEGRQRDDHQRRPARAEEGQRRPEPRDQVGPLGQDPVKRRDGRQAGDQVEARPRRAVDQRHAAEPASRRQHAGRAPEPPPSAVGQDQPGEDPGDRRRPPDRGRGGNPPCLAPRPEHAGGDLRRPERGLPAAEDLAERPETFAGREPQPRLDRPEVEVAPADQHEARRQRDQGRPEADPPDDRCPIGTVGAGPGDGRAAVTGSADIDGLLDARGPVGEVAVVRDRRLVALAVWPSLDHPIDVARQPAFAIGLAAPSLSERRRRSSRRARTGRARRPRPVRQVPRAQWTRTGRRSRSSQALSTSRNCASWPKPSPDIGRFMKSIPIRRARDRSASTPSPGTWKLMMVRIS